MKSVYNVNNTPAIQKFWVAAKDSMAILHLLRLGVPIAVSALIGIFVDLVITRILGLSNIGNYYFLSLYLPISYLLIAIMESCRANVIYLSASFHMSIEEKQLGDKIILLISYGLMAFIFLWCAFKLCQSEFFAMNKIIYTQQYILQGFISIMLLLASIRYTSYILVGVLYGFGKVYIAMFLAFVSGLCSIFLTYLFAKYTQPSIYSQAYALTVSSCMVVVCVLLLVKTKSLFAHISYKKLSRNFFPFMRQVIRFSSPIFISYLVIFFSLFLFNLIVSRFGQNALAGFGIAYRIQSMIILPAIALGIATGIAINQKKQNTSVLHSSHLLRVSLLWSTLFYCLLALIVFLFREKIIYLIVPSGAIANYGDQFLYYVAPSYFGMGPLLVLLTTMEQTGHGAKALIFNCIYFLTIIGIGGLLALKFQHIELLFQVMCGVNLLSWIITMYYCFLRDRNFLDGTAFLKFEVI